MPRLLAIALAALAHLAVVTAPASGQHEVRLPAAQEAAAQRLARALVDGDSSRQVFTAGHATRLCYRAAVANPSNAAGMPDRDRLTPAQRVQFSECVEQSGYRLRGG